MRKFRTKPSMTIVKPSSSLIVRQCTSCHHQTFQQWQRRVCWQGLEPREHRGSQTLQRSSFHSSISHCPFYSWTWTIMCFSLWDGDLASHVLMFLPLRSQCRKLAEALLFLSVSLMISFRWILNLFWPLERWFHPWYFLFSGWGTKLSLPPAGLSQIRIYEFRKAEIF